MQVEESSRQDNSVTHWPNSFKEDAATLSRTSFAGIQFQHASGVPSVNVDGIIAENTEDASAGDQTSYQSSPTAANVPAKSRLFAYIDLHGHASKRGKYLFC